jgi:excisionase family DNA binding protein
MPSDDGALTVSNFTKEYGVGKNLIYDEIAAGRLRAVKVGSRKTLIPRQSAREWAPIAGAGRVGAF